MGGFNSGPTASDEHAANTLYQTDDGRYFLYMFGGRKTTYARKVGPIPIAGEDIRPLTSKQAAKWARKHLTYREVKALFPDEKM